MFVAEVLEKNEARHGIVKSRPHSDRLARTTACVKVTPHLHTHKHMQTQHHCSVVVQWHQSMPTTIKYNDNISRQCWERYSYG